MTYNVMMILHIGFASGGKTVNGMDVEAIVDDLAIRSTASLLTLPRSCGRHLLISQQLHNEKSAYLELASTNVDDICRLSQNKFTRR